MSRKMVDICSIMLYNLDQINMKGMLSLWYLLVFFMLFKRTTKRGRPKMAEFRKRSVLYSVQLQVRISEDQKRVLEKLSEMQDRSISSLVRRWVNNEKEAYRL